MGDGDSFSVRHRILNSILFLGLTLSFLGSGINYLLDMPKTGVVAPFAAGLYLVLLFYLTRLQRHYSLAIGGAMALIVVILPVLWLGTTGSLSRVPMMVLLFVPMMAILLDGFVRVSAIGLLIVLCNGLIYWEYLHPQPIHLFLHSPARYLDLAFTLTVSIMSSAIVFGKIFGYYQNEFRRANHFLQKSRNTQNKLRYLSYHDKLTHVFNRTYFEERLLQLEQEIHQPIGVFFVDVDGLKFVNDTLGHDFGDQLLMRCVAVLRRIFAASGTLFRIGGDEFVVILENCGSTEMEQYYAELLKQVHAELASSEPDYPLQLSFGFASGPNTELRELLKDAEGKMYRAKLLHQADDSRSIMQTVQQMLSVRDFATGAHSERLESRIVELARMVGVPSSSMTDLRLLAKFHDIGKIGIPDPILLKPGPLNPEEWVVLKKHCEIGYRIAHSSMELRPIANWILKHHECWDGAGYPLGLKGEEIPLECRLLAIVDSYDAMISDRPYRKGMTTEKAEREIQRCAGSQFDPFLAEKFLELLQAEKEVEKSCFPSPGFSVYAFRGGDA